MRRGHAALHLQRQAGDGFDRRCRRGCASLAQRDRPPGRARRRSAAAASGRRQGMMARSSGAPVSGGSAPSSSAFCRRLSTRSDACRAIEQSLGLLQRALGRRACCAARLLGSDAGRARARAQIADSSAAPMTPMTTARRMTSTVMRVTPAAACSAPEPRSADSAASAVPTRSEIRLAMREHGRRRGADGFGAGISFGRP